jgi:hypothetical protein
MNFSREKHKKSENPKSFLHKAISEKLRISLGKRVMEDTKRFKN